MSHEVETMAYTNEVPWHGLGYHVAEAPTVKGMLKAAKLNWRVERAPLFTCDQREDKEQTLTDDGDHLTGGTERVPGFAALRRSSDGKVLDVVGSRYIPAQNEEVFEFFHEFVEAGGAKMETAGSLKEGRYVWGLANLNASFKMRGDDEVKGYLLVASPHEQGKSLIVRFTTVRVVCNNTLTLALSDGGTEFRMNHRNIFDEAMMAKAKDTLGIARDQLGEFEANARLLQKLKLTEKDVITILADTFQPNADIKELLSDFDEHGTARMKTLLDIHRRAPGAQPDNAWGLLNSVTYYADHVASRTSDKRLTNAWIGKTSIIKERVFAELIQRAS